MNTDKHGSDLGPRIPDNASLLKSAEAQEFCRIGTTRAHRTTWRTGEEISLR